MSTLALDISKTDFLKPILEMVFYQNDSRFYAEFCEINNDERSSFKPVSYEGLEYLMSKIKSAQIETKKDTIVKFDNIIPDNVIHFNPDLLNIELVWIKPSHKNEFKYKNGEGFLIYPHLMFMLKRKQFHVYALKTINIKPNTPLYKAPFPNVYGDGKLCLGTMNINDFMKGNFNKIMANMEKMFFGSKFTLELMDSNVSATNTHSLLAKLMKKNQPFPKEKLVKLNKTVANALRS